MNRENLKGYFRCNSGKRLELCDGKEAISL